MVKQKIKFKEKLCDFSFFSNNIIGGDIITFKYRYRKQILTGVICFIILCVIIISIVIGFSKEESSKDNIVISKKIKKKKRKEELPEKIKVDIKGEVINPGIYELNLESRVIDVIAQAGGLTSNADTSVINLSKKISDEMVIIIYSHREVKEFEKTKEKEEQVINKCVQKDSNSLINDACIKTDTKNTVNKDNKNTKISINTGTKEELMTLTGIGEAKAKDIINYREKNGPFKAIEDLKKVSGIGDNIFAQIKENIIL